MLKNLHYHLFFNHKDSKYNYNNSDDSDVDSDDDSGCISLKLISWFNKYNQWKEYKKRLMPIPWLPTRVWDWCMSEDEKRDRISDWQKAVLL